MNKVTLESKEMILIKRVLVNALSLLKFVILFPNDDLYAVCFMKARRRIIKISYIYIILIQNFDIMKYFNHIQIKQSIFIIT